MKPFHCIISNFDKKFVLLLTKDFFSQIFQFHIFNKSELCKNGT